MQHKRGYNSSVCIFLSIIWMGKIIQRHFSKYFFFLFYRKKVILVWNDMVSKWWQNLNFWVKFPFNKSAESSSVPCSDKVQKHQQEAEYILHSQQGVGAFLNFSLTLTIVIEWLLSVINQKVGAWVFIFSLQPKIPLSPFPLHTVCVLFCPVGGAKTVPVQ